MPPPRQLDPRCVFLQLVNGYVNSKEKKVIKAKANPALCQSGLNEHSSADGLQIATASSWVVILAACADEEAHPAGISQRHG